MQTNGGNKLELTGTCISLNLLPPPSATKRKIRIVEFITNNLGPVVTLVLGFIAWITTYAVLTARVTDVIRKVDHMDTNGSIFAREAQIRHEALIGEQNRRLINNEGDTKILINKMNELGGDIKVIRALMEEQKSGV